MFEWIQETVRSQDRIVDASLKILEEASAQRTMASQKHLSFTQTMSGIIVELDIVEIVLGPSFFS